MADPVTLEQFLGILLVAMGGREGIATIIRRRNGKKNGLVTEALCKERHGHLEKLVDEVRGDVKELLRRTN